MPELLQWMHDKIDALQAAALSPHQRALLELEPTIEKPGIRSGTAFVIMAMDPRKPELDDVYAAIKGVCAEFNVAARRADKVEHDERITDLILNEIRTSEFLIADLTYERPNVYYEVGYAHALGKRTTLFRRDGTVLHFDLAVHNVREYRNLEQLKDQLRSRFRAIFDLEPAEPKTKRGSRSKKELDAAVAVHRVRKSKARKHGDA